MPPEDWVRIRHMIDAAETIAAFTASRQRADLETDRMLLFALVRAIEIIGEAASKVSPQTRSAVPDVPWGLITAMRNRLVHAYFDIDKDVLWRTAVDEVPGLLALLQTATK